MRISRGLFTRIALAAMLAFAPALAEAKMGGSFGGGGAGSRGSRTLSVSAHSSRIATTRHASGKDGRPAQRARSGQGAQGREEGGCPWELRSPQSFAA